MTNEADTDKTISRLCFGISDVAAEIDGYAAIAALLDDHLVQLPQDEECRGQMTARALSRGLYRLRDQLLTLLSPI